MKSLEKFWADHELEWFRLGNIIPTVGGVNETLMYKPFSLDISNIFCAISRELWIILSEALSEEVNQASADEISNKWQTSIV